MTRRQALGSVAAAGAGPLIAASAAAQDSILRVAGRAVELTVTAVSRVTARLTMQPIEDGRPAAMAADGALAREDFGAPAVRWRELAGPRAVRCGDLTIHVTPSLAFRIEAKGGRLVQEIWCERETGRLSFSLGTGAIFGLGQGGPQFDRRGNLDRMISGQGGYRLGTHGAKAPVQLAIGTSGWALFVHRPMGAFDLTGDKGQLVPPTSPVRVGEAGPVAGRAEIAPPGPEAILPIDLFAIAATDPAGVMAEYAGITGHPEMPPLWAFGYQQSHRTLGPPEEILQEARTFREKRLPCDAMIYLGTDFCPNGWNTHNGEFTWNEKAFPDPPAAMRGLQEQHFKTVLHVVIEGRHLTGTVNDACTAAALPSGRTSDGRWPPDRQVSCYWPFHKPLFDLGIDGWWPDQGDGLDAPSRLARIRMYYEGHQKYRPNQRVYALHRNGYAGMARFAAFLWSGDIQSTWETLKTHVPVGINAGLSGIPFWGTDIGGFVPTAEYTGELYARWFQFAAFNPLFRSHGRDWRLHLPWGWTVGEMGVPETPSYHPDAGVLHNPAIEPVCKKYLELRYQLMPYLYSAVKETCETGLPILRALWLHYADDAAAVARGDEYLFGRDLLVAPVVEKGATSRIVYLPRGAWYDFWTGERVAGGREVTRPVDLATIPLYVRAGAVLPLDPVRQYTGEPVEGPLTLWVHPGADGRASLYEDDGSTFDYRSGDFMRVAMEWNDRRRVLGVRLAAGSKMRGAARRNLIVRVAGETTSKEAMFSGRPIEVRL